MHLKYQGKADNKIGSVQVRDNGGVNHEGI